MKKLLGILAIVVLAVTFAVAQSGKKGPIATFKQSEIDYGKINKGDDPLRVYEFSNTGDEPLIVKNAKGSCGCTVPTYPKEPIMPGQSAKIEVRYDTQRVGPFSKSITLTTNEANETRVLSIKGEVKPSPNDGQGVPVAQPSVLSPKG